MWKCGNYTIAQKLYESEHGCYNMTKSKPDALGVALQKARGLGVPGQKFETDW